MSHDSHFLSPDESPHEVNTIAGVRRVNKLPLMIFAVILILFTVLMAIVISNRGLDHNAKNHKNEGKNVQSSDSFANMIARDHHLQGIIPPKQTQSNSEIPFEPNEIIIERPVNLELPPTPLRYAQNSHSVRDYNQDHILMLKRQQLEEAIKAKTLVNTSLPKSNKNNSVQATGGREIEAFDQKTPRTSKQNQQNVPGSFQQRMNELRSAGFGMNPIDEPMMLVNDDAGDRADNDYSQFDSHNRKTRWKLDSDVEKTAAKYVIQTGFVIPGILITGVNSDLPGQITAQVSQNVYDTPVGQHLLIPQGSKLIGAYNSEVAYGQERVLIAWQRIIFPDGKTLDIGSMPGADMAGYAGAKDKVNNHYVRLFGSALLMSAIIAGATYSQRDAGSAFGRQNAGSILSQAMGQQLGMVTANMIRRNLNISPTIEIRPGFKFNVMVTKDMVFNRPYQSFDYNLAAK